VSKRTGPPVKNQHFVPQFYLKYFSLPDSDQLAVLDKSTGKCFKSNTSKVASRGYFYDFEGDDVLQALGDQPMEQFYGIIETEMSKNWVILLRNLNEHHGFAVTDKPKMSLYIMEQYGRTPQFRRVMDEGLQQWAWRELQAKQERGELQVPEHLKHLSLEQMARSLKHHDLNYVKMTSEGGDDLRQELEARLWMVLEQGGDVPFITSDAPVQTVVTTGQGQGIYYPLSSHYALMMLEPQSPSADQAPDDCDCRVGRLPDQEVINLNRMMLHQAERQVYASTNDWGLVLGLSQAEVETLLRELQGAREE